MISLFLTASLPTLTKAKDGFTIPNLTDLILLNFRLPSERNGCPCLRCDEFSGIARKNWFTCVD